MIRTKMPFEFRVPLIYIMMGFLWILFSDKLLFAFFSNPRQISQISTVKGWTYVLITGLLLYYLIKKEIAKRTLLYNDLLLANQKAAESERLKSAFLSNLSHYIRTPMNSILGFIDLLEYRNIDEENRLHFLNIINEQSQHLLFLIKNIVEIAKLQEGQMVVRKKDFHINESIHYLEMAFKGIIMQKNSNVNIYSSVGMRENNDVICSDEEIIQNIISNLLTNALNNTKKGVIQFGYRIENNELIFFVNDSGPAILKEKFETLISGFLDDSHAGNDSGIGLFLSAGLAKALGGKLWLETTTIEGNTLCFNVPNYNHRQIIDKQKIA